jgi:hypothetical protein
MNATPELYVIRTHHRRSILTIGGESEAAADRCDCTDALNGALAE